MEFETPVNGSFSKEQLLPPSGTEMLDHLRALSEEVRYRIGEVKRAVERLDEAQCHLVAVLQQTQGPQEPPF
jgi:hypothetical protein